MNIDWSYHAEDQFLEILRTIAHELSYEDAVRWKQKIDEALAPLSDYPELGANIPLDCFFTQPLLADRLRQIIVRPYRIVYEPVAEKCRILAVLHCRMLVRDRDTLWDK